MENGSYIVVLSGKLKPGGDPDKAAKILSKVFSIPAEKGRAMFDGSPTPLRKKMDHQLASKVCHALLHAGADCHLESLMEEEEMELSLEAAYQEANKFSDPFDTDDQTVGARTAADSPQPAPEAIQRNVAAQSNELTLEQQQEMRPDAESSILISGTLSGTGKSKKNEPTQKDFVDVEAIKRREEQAGEEDLSFDDDPQWVKDVLKNYLNPRIIMLAVILILAIFALGYPFLFSTSDLDTRLVKEPKAPQSRVKVEKAQFLQESEVSFTKLKLNSAAQSIRVWMMQFGGGYRPEQVTLSRLKVDMGVTDEDLTDSWGMKIRYVPIESGFSLLSAGPDKKFDSADDIKIDQQR